MKYHQIAKQQLIEHKVYEGKGRPKIDTPVKCIEWQITAGLIENEAVIKQIVEQKSCFVLATNIDKEVLSPEKLVRHYKAQSEVEKGFRFLKAIYFCLFLIYQKAK